MKTDVIIVGGGLVGAPLASLLSKASFRVSLVDQTPFSLPYSPDRRTTSISWGSKLLFERWGLWQDLSPYVHPINHIRVFEEKKGWSIHYNASDVGDHPMGYIVENTLLRQVFHSHLSHPNLSYRAPNHVQSYEAKEGGVQVTLDTGEVLEASLLIAADGGNSSLRKQANIPVWQRPYPHSALVFQVTHPLPHHSTAWEMFTPQGPLALLPMNEDPTFCSGVVWTLPHAEAEAMMKWETDILCQELSKHFTFYGAFQPAQPFTKACYPLSLVLPKRCSDKRLVLIGDAAHKLHPIAGQGVNLGWRDVDQLSQKLLKQKELGLDIGSSLFLKSYECQRKKDVWPMAAMTHGVNQLFSNSSTILTFLRNGGLGVVNQLPPLKRFFMHKAMGL